MMNPARNLRYLIPAALSLFALALLTGCSGSSDMLRPIAGHHFAGDAAVPLTPLPAENHHQLHVHLHGLPQIAATASLRPTIHSL